MDKFRLKNMRSTVVEFLDTDGVTHALRPGAISDPYAAHEFSWDMLGKTGRDDLRRIPVEVLPAADPPEDKEAIDTLDDEEE